MTEPAFPSPNSVTIGDMMTNGHPGMTLRDWFAGRAIDAAWATAMEHSRSPEAPEQFAARQAYEMADAMLAARKLSPDRGNGE